MDLFLKISVLQPICRWLRGLGKIICPWKESVARNRQFRVFEGIWRVVSIIAGMCYSVSETSSPSRSPMKSVNFALRPNPIFYRGRLPPPPSPSLKR